MNRTRPQLVRLSATCLLPEEMPLPEHRTEIAPRVFLEVERYDGYAFLTIEAANERIGHTTFRKLKKELGPNRVREGRTDPGNLLFSLLVSRGRVMAVAESCTGGLVAKALTDIPGSSAVFWGGVVVYSNEAKRTLLGVPTTLLQRYGAVSEEVVRALAHNLRLRSGADLTLAVSGIAGPEGGSVEKPVGTVWLSAESSSAVRSRCFQFQGGRKAVRAQALAAGVLLIEEILF
ncbi:MAG TPA: CinA family protein [Spirochaetia bacterium]|nr:CinA family protein [Spirochaetia bacterium]